MHGCLILLLILVYFVGESLHTWFTVVHSGFYFGCNASVTLAHHIYWCGVKSIDQGIEIDINNVQILVSAIVEVESNFLQTTVSFWNWFIRT